MRITLYGVPQNPYGGAQFFAAAMGDDAYARSQHDYNWAAESIVRISYDFWREVYRRCRRSTTWVAGPCSLPDRSAGRRSTCRACTPGLDTAGGTAIHAGYLIDENPAAPPAFPGPEWQNLPVDHWFRQTVLVNMEYFKIIECTIQDLTIGGPVTVAHPENWHFINYAVAGGTLPTGFRCFTGGTTAGNFLAWDNFSIPEPATIALLLIGFTRCVSANSILSRILELQPLRSSRPGGLYCRLFASTVTVLAERCKRGKLEAFQAEIVMRVLLLPRRDTCGL